MQNKDACFERKLVGKFSPFQGQKRHLSESAAKVYGKVAKRYTSSRQDFTRKFASSSNSLNWGFL